MRHIPPASKLIVDAARKPHKEYMMSYIPRRDADFDLWYANLVDKVRENALSVGPPPRWSHIPQATVLELIARFDAWHAAFLKLAGPHTEVDTFQKNLERQRSESFLRSFVQRYLKFDPVTDADRLAMGVTVRASGNTHSGKITEMVEAESVLRKIRQVVWKYWILGALNRAKPAHAHGVECAWAILDHPPSGIEELIHRSSDTASPLTLYFADEDRGKTVYCCFRWIGRTEGTDGDWGEYYSAMIP
jgi:hypothetical protein